MNARGNPCIDPRIDPGEAELRAGNDCLRVADDYAAIGEHNAALMFARQAQVHYERAAAIRARQSAMSQPTVSQSEAGSSSTGTTEAA
jgi:hypothetical protein